MKLTQLLGLAAVLACGVTLCAQSGVPVAGTGGGALDATTSVQTVTFNVSGLTGGNVGDVELTIAIWHDYLGDVDLVLDGPNSTSHLIFQKIEGGLYGSEAHFGNVTGTTHGLYSFADSGSPSLWADVLATSPGVEFVPSGTYQAVDVAGTPTVITASFSGLAAAQANGTWTLTFTDTYPSFDHGHVDATQCSLTITTPAAPDMSIERNSAVVTNAGNDSVSDVSTAGEIFTYEIHNNGTADLTLTGNPIIDITPGTGAPTVNIVTAPAMSVIPFPGMTSFQIEVIPAVGAFDFTISIDNDDPAKNPYAFTVDGNGIITNMPAEAEIAAGSAFAGGTNGPFVMDADPAETLSNAAIELTDPDLDDITITNITPPATALTGITPPGIGTAGHPRLLEWTGTVDAANAPGDYTWEIEFEDTAGTATPVVIFVTISVNDVAPEHVIANADGGDGTSAATPYTAEYTQGDDATATVDLATVTDPNSGQAASLSVGGIMLGTSNPGGGVGFQFDVTGGMFVIAPAAPLEAGDMGTHTFEVVVTDGTNPVSIHVSVLVYGATGAITFTTTSPLPSGRVNQVYDQTIDIAGATGTATFSIQSGALPVGLTMDSSGHITGTPTAAGQSTFTVHVVDSGPDTATMAFELNVSPEPVGGSGSSGSDGCSTSEGSSTTMLIVLAAIAGAGAILRLRRRAA